MFRRTSDLAISFRQLGTMLSAGLPLTQALDTLSSGHQAGWESVFSAAEEQVRRGRTLSHGLGVSAPQLGPTVMGLLEAGDRVGRQDEACYQVAEYLERRVKTRREVTRELLYPIVVFVVGLLLAPLPRLVTDGLHAYLASLAPPFFGVVLLGVAALVARRFAAVEPFRLRIDGVLLATPVVRSIVASAALARVARGLALGARAGLPLGDTLQLAAESAGNLAIRNRMLRYVRARGLASDVVSGMLSTIPLSPPMAIQMAKTGEATGELSAMLDKLAEYLDAENKHRRDRFIKLFGVGVYLLVAGWVAVQVIGFWGGLYGSIAGG